MAAGYDPAVGIMHDRKLLRGTYPALALDWMEPMRPIVDRAVLNTVKEEPLTGADFTIQENGVCRLNPEMARRLVQRVMEAIP